MAKPMLVKQKKKKKKKGEDHLTIDIARDIITVVYLENMADISFCTTKLKFKLEEPDWVDLDVLREVNSVAGVIMDEKAKTLDIVVGPNAPVLFRTLKKEIKKGFVTKEKWIQVEDEYEQEFPDVDELTTDELKEWARYYKIPNANKLKKFELKRELDKVFKNRR